MRNLCFTERSLQFSKFTHKSLGSSISLPPLFFLSPFFLIRFPSSTGGPIWAPLPASLCCSGPAREQAALAARVSQRRRAGACAARCDSGGVRTRCRCWAGAARGRRRRGRPRASKHARERAWRGRAQGRSTGGGLAQAHEPSGAGGVCRRWAAQR
jgi:hypothetical protein